MINIQLPNNFPKFNNLRFKYFILFGSCLLVLGYSSVIAQTSTDSSSLRDTVKQKVAEELSQIKKAITKKAYLGSITSKADITLTINNYFNQSRSVVVNTDTVIKLASGRDGTLKDLTVGNFILPMGDADSQNTLTAKRLLVITQPPEDKRQLVYGKVTAATTSTLTVETLDKTVFTTKLTSETKIYTKDATGLAKAKISDLKINSLVALLAKPGTTPSAAIVYIFPASSPTPTP